MEIDLSRVKVEPVEDVDALALETVTVLDGDNHSVGSDSDSKTRKNRIRMRSYNRKNYHQPQSNVCEVCQAEFAGKGTGIFFTDHYAVI